MSPQKIPETRLALFLLVFSLLSILRFGRVGRDVRAERL